MAKNCSSPKESLLTQRWKHSRAASSYQIIEVINETKFDEEIFKSPIQTCSVNVMRQVPWSCKQPKWEMEKKDTGDGNFSSLFWSVRVRAKKKDPKYGETEVIHTEKIRIRMWCRCPQSSLSVPTFGIVNTKTLRDYLHISNSSNL